jgi:hypothetical protein
MAKSRLDEVDDFSIADSAVRKRILVATIQKVGVLF